MDVNITFLSLTGKKLLKIVVPDDTSAEFQIREAVRCAILSGADLNGADLSYANLSRAILSGAIKDAKTILPHYRIAPEVGSFIAFKKLRNNVVATLEIPAEAKRTSSLIGRKCRAEFAKVVALSSNAVVGYAKHWPSGVFPYHVGEIVRPDSFDDDIRLECANGIHFFMTRREAEEY